MAPMARDSPRARFRLAPCGAAALNDPRGFVKLVRLLWVDAPRGLLPSHRPTRHPCRNRCCRPFPRISGDAWALNRSRFGGAGNTEKVESSTVVNARVSYPVPMLGKKGEVFVAAENLLDSKYSYRPGYPMPGIWGQVGIAASF